MQLTAVALTTRALAVARTPCDVMPSSGPKNTGSATLPLEPSRYTFTRAHLPEKPGGQSKNTSTPEEAPACDGQTGFANGAAVGQLADRDAHSAVNFALLNGLVVVGGLSTSSKASATAPARAPASAAFCACPLDTQSTPWSTTNAVNPVNARIAIATWTRIAPRSPLPRLTYASMFKTSTPKGFCVS